MGRHVAGDMPGLDRLVDDACAGIGREIAELRIPRLWGVVLGGGYGRGEGGALIREESGKREKGNEDAALYNDLDFFAITEEGAPEAETVASIGAVLKPISEKWSAKLGIDVDFTVRTPWRIRHDQERLMIQELLRGHCDVAGAKGEELFSGVEMADVSKLPWMEAARLLMNRGMGLLLAKRKIENRASGECRDFVNRNINKCILGAGDARLIARHAYAWRAEERAKALGDGLYSAAVEWKFRPGEAPVCDWEKAREVWLEALEEVSCGSGSSRDSRNSRSVRNAVRWLVRRRSVGDLRTFALDPVVRVLESVARRVRDRGAIDDALTRDWQVFN